MYAKQERMMQMTFTKLPKAITAEELLSTPLPPVKWIVPGLLPAGLALFAGPSKAGKSWLTLWLCLQVAQGMRIKPAQFPLSPMTISCNASSQQQAITNKRPYCLRKPCSYKADGTCSGPVVAIQDYYGLHNCPGDPDPGETPRCGRYAECAYCRVGHRRK